jgi:hypothetical protein
MANSSLPYFRLQNILNVACVSSHPWESWLETPPHAFAADPSHSRSYARSHCRYWWRQSCAKGNRFYRIFGNVFTLAMLKPASSGFLLAILKSKISNVIAAVLTFYLTESTWVAGRRQDRLVFLAGQAA